MKKNYFNYLLIIIFLLFFLSVGNVLFGQKYIVQSNRMNIRKSPSDTSEVIGKLLKGDTVNVILSKGDWLKISITETGGYVHKNFVKRINESDKSDKSKTDSQKGFKNGFFIGIYSSFIWVLLTVGSLFEGKTRIIDGRFKKGFRQREFKMKEIGVILLYTVIITSFIGLITGIVYWVQSF